MSAAWERELKRLERDVEAALALLATDDTPPAERWSPPDGIGPMPPELRPRAQALLDRLTHASEQAATRREELRVELGELQHRRDAARAYNTNDPSDMTNGG